MPALKINAIAKQLGMNPQTARRLARENKIPGVQRIGGRWYVHEETLYASFGAARKCSQAAHLPSYSGVVEAELKRMLSEPDAQGATVADDGGAWL